MRRDILAAAAAVLAVACGGGTDAPEPAATPETAAPAALPDRIVAERGGFIPEGVEYDAANGRFLTGSIAEGSIFQIGPDGDLTTLVIDPELVSSVGIEADEERDRLLVANADAAVFQGGGTGQAKLGVYRLSSGERLAMVDLTAAIANAPADAVHFANDVTVAPDGTIFVTDTRAGVIYRVSGDEYRPEVLYGPQADFTPNGLVHHPSGYLLVGSGATLWKVPVGDPAAAAPVMLPEEIPGQDGLIWIDEEMLGIVSNSGNRVVALTSTDEWATAQLAGVASYTEQATTAAVAGGDVYVVHPHFNDDQPPSLERVVFD